MAEDVVGEDVVVTEDNTILSPRARRVGSYTLLGVLSILVVLPIYLTIVRALSAPLAYADAGSPMYPVDIEWGIFATAWREGNLARPLVNSTIMTVGVTALQVVTSVLAAYAFVFLRFPFKRLVFALVMTTLMLPLEVTLIGNVQTVRQLDWINSYQALILPLGATAFGIFLLRQSFAGLPSELAEAARLDGYGHFEFLWRFVVPLNRPVVASLTLVAALSAWNQYLLPRAVVEKASSETIQTAIRALSVQELDRLNIPVAAAVLASIPVFVLLIVFQKQIVRGLTAGAVKG